MSTVAVVAHARKTFGGGLPELRRVLARESVTDPLWYEVKKSRKAPKYARRAAAQGADLVFVWGGWSPLLGGGWFGLAVQGLAGHGVSLGRVARSKTVMISRE
jgi:diacylglycerol kinase (ATP)